MLLLRTGTNDARGEALCAAKGWTIRRYWRDIAKRFLHAYTRRGVFISNSDQKKRTALRRALCITSSYRIGANLNWRRSIMADKHPRSESGRETPKYAKSGDSQKTGAETGSSSSAQSSSTAGPSAAGPSTGAPSQGQSTSTGEASTRYDPARDVSVWKCSRCGKVCLNKGGLTVRNRTISNQYFLSIV